MYKYIYVHVYIYIYIYICISIYTCIYIYIYIYIYTYIYIGSICRQQLFRSLRAHQRSSDQMKILKDQSTQTTTRAVGNVNIYIYIYIYIYAHDSLKRPKIVCVILIFLKGNGEQYDP